MYIYIYIYILISNFSANPNFFQFSTPIHISISRSNLTFHNSAAWEIVSRIMPVTSGDFYITISYALWVYRSGDSHINTHTSNIVNWYRNGCAKLYYRISRCLLFKHGRRLNSTVSNNANNMKVIKTLLWLWQYLFRMQYEHEGVEITLSVLDFQI